MTKHIHFFTFPNRKRRKPYFYVSRLSAKRKRRKSYFYDSRLSCISLL